MYIVAHDFHSRITGFMRLAYSAAAKPSTIQGLVTVFFLFVLIETGFGLVQGGPLPVSIEFVDRTGGSVSISREFPGKVFEVSEKLLSFGIDITAPAQITVRSGVFPIQSGQAYLLNFSCLPPRAVTATKDSTLVFVLENARNCTVSIEKSRGDNLLPNPSFEQADEAGKATGWNGLVEKRLRPTISWGHENMAFIDVDEKETPVKGTAIAAKNLARTGTNSFYLEKETFAGTVRCEPAMPLAVKEGTEYLFSAYLRVEQPSFGAGVYLRVILSGKDKQAKDFGTRHYVSAVLDNPKEGWRRIWLRFTVPAGYTNALPGAEIRGAALKTWWDDFDLRPAPTPVEQAFSDQEDHTPKYSSEEVRAIWKNRNPRRVEVKNTDGQPVLTVDGKPVPLLAYPCVCGWWPGCSEHKLMNRAGVKLHFIPLLSKNFWKGKDTYDFSGIGKNIETLLGYDPDAMVLFYFSIEPYRTWGDENPDAVWHNPEGKKVAGTKTWATPEKLGPKDHWSVSYTAEEFRRDEKNMLVALAKYLNSIEVGKAVVGAHFVCGTDGQWFPQYKWNTLDYSPGNRKAFQGYLRKIYNNDVAALRKAWADPAVTFENAQVASEEACGPERWDKWFFDPAVGSDRHVLDSNRFAPIGVTETIIELATAFKSALGRNVYLSTYHHDVMHGVSPHRAQQMLLESPALDGIVSVMEYGGTRSLGQTGGMNALAASLRLHNKIWLHELDYRTYLTYLGEDANDTRLSLGAEKTAAEWLNQARRDFGMALCQGEGAWLYDLAGPAYTTEEFNNGLTELVKAANWAVRQPMPQDRGQIAVFCDERSEEYMTRFAIFSAAYGMVANGAGKLPLLRSGLSWDPYLLSDLENLQRHKYKMHIFLTATTITQEQIEWVRQNLQKDGNVLVWLGTAGMSSGGDFENNIRRLTGMTVKYDPKQFDLRRIYPVPSDDPLAKGLLDNMTTEFRSPLFYVDDPKAKTLGVITKTGGKTGWAVKRFSGWTSVYIALPGALTPELVRNIAEEAGIIPTGPNGDVTLSGNGFLVIHALSGGDKTLRWKGKGDVLDLTTGEFIARAAESLAFKMNAFETRWFRRYPEQSAMIQAPHSATTQEPCGLNRFRKYWSILLNFLKQKGYIAY